MTVLVGILMIVAGCASGWYITRPSDSAKIPGIEIPGLIFAVALVFSGIHVLVDPSWSLWPSGKWIAVTGDVGAVFCLFLYAIAMPDFVWALIGIPIFSALSIVGSGGSLVACLASHVHVSASWI